MIICWDDFRGRSAASKFGGGGVESRHASYRSRCRSRFRWRLSPCVPKGADMVTTPAESAQPEISARPTTDSIAPSGAAQLGGGGVMHAGLSGQAQLDGPARMSKRAMDTARPVVHPLRGRTRKSGGVSPFPQLLAAIRLTGRLRDGPATEPFARAVKGHWLAGPFSSRRCSHLALLPASGFPERARAIIISGSRAVRSTRGRGSHPRKAGHLALPARAWGQRDRAARDTSSPPGSQPRGMARRGYPIHSSGVETERCADTQTGGSRVRTGLGKPIAVVLGTDAEAWHQAVLGRHPLSPSCRSGARPAVDLDRIRGGMNIRRGRNPRLASGYDSTVVLGQKHPLQLGICTQPSVFQAKPMRPATTDPLADQADGTGRRSPRTGSAAAIPSESRGNPVSRLSAPVVCAQTRMWQPKGTGRGSGWEPRAHNLPWTRP